MNDENEKWHIGTDGIDLLPDGMIVDVITSINETDHCVGLLCGVIKKGRIRMPSTGRDLDITDSVIKWHAILNLIERKGRVYWTE